MRRQRTIVGNPEESSLRHASPRHTMSPRSINSDGSDRSFECDGSGIHTSFGCSTIGHDDPTLVCTNVKENQITRNDETIKNINSEALASFLTVSYSEDEKRDPTGEVERSNESLSDELRQQLVELDRTQDEWKAKQQEGSGDEIDDITDFYVKEAGEYAPSPRRRIPFKLNEETIYEEENPRISNDSEVESRETPSETESTSLEEQKNAEASSSHSQRRRMEMVVKATSPRKSKREQGKETPDQTAKQHIVDKENSQSLQKQRVEEDSPVISNGNPDTRQNQEAPGGYVPSQSHKYQSREYVAGTTTHQDEESNVENDGNREESTIMGAKKKTAGFAASPVKSVDSDLDFEYPSGDDQSITKRMAEAHTADDDDEEPSDRTKDRSYVKVGDNIELSNTAKDPDEADAEIADTHKIIRAVQERLQDLSSSHFSGIPYATDHPAYSSSTQESKKPGLWYQSNNGIIESGMLKMIAWKRSKALAAKVDLSNDEDDQNVYSGSDPVRRRKWKSLIVNVCIAIVLIAAIVCTVLFATKLRESRKNKSGSPVIETNENRENADPTASPFESMQPEIPANDPTGSEPAIVTQTETPSRNPTASPFESMQPQIPANDPTGSEPAIITQTETPSRNPTASPFESMQPEIPANDPTGSEPAIVTQTEAPSRNPLAPTPQSSSLEDRLHIISGDTIHNITTPQHDAYDWLLNKDPASLDLETVTDSELNQRYIAALFYYSMDGGNWIEQYGFLGGSHVCDWNGGFAKDTMGIICDDAKQITGFALNENGLRGQIPGELQKLTDMGKVQLRANAIYGTLPSELSKLTMLQEIDLRQNHLSGTVPESIFNMPEIKKILLLRNSGLTGTIPASIQKASNLEILSFQKCSIAGSLPSTIGNLSNLIFVTFMDNMLTGRIPESLANLSHLEVLELSGNDLTGTIPGLENLDKLYFVSLFDNKLTGTIPASLGMLQNLMFLNIKNNRLDGTIPPEIGRLPGLVTFFGENNRLTGILPPFLYNNGDLQAINLSRNKLTGDIDGIFGPEGPSGRLVRVDLAHNNLIGSIPSSIGSFDSLSELNLRGNSLTGSIPKEVRWLSEMDTLNLQGNNLVGTLPEELGLMEQLIYLNLASNDLVGTIPDTLGLLERLTVLDLNSNELVGSIPTIFGQLNNLDELYLNDNNLTGDLSETFCKRSTSVAAPFQYVGTFAADCMGPSAAVTCSCCTVCCRDENCSPVSSSIGK